MLDSKTKRASTCVIMQTMAGWLAGHRGEQGTISESGEVTISGDTQQIEGFDADHHYHGPFRIEVTPDVVQVQFPAARKVVEGSYVE